MEILPQITQILAETPSIAVDTIRASFLKNRVTHKHYTKIELLKSIAKAHGLKWRKMQDTKEIKISNRYEFRGLKITELYELENLSIFYATTKAPNECRQRAVIEFYGLKQYHKPAPPFDLVAELLGAVNNVSTAPIIDLNKPALLPRAERLELQLRQAVRDFSQIIDLATEAQPAKPTYKAKNNKRELRA